MMVAMAGARLKPLHLSRHLMRLYSFVCSFPGHGIIMRGVLHAK
jgi:azurin